MDFNDYILAVLKTLRGDVMAASELLYFGSKTLNLKDNFMAGNYVVLPGSAKSMPFGARIMAPADKSQVLTVSVYLRKFDSRSSDSLAAIRAFAVAKGLTIDENHTGYVQLTGTVDAMEKAFMVQLKAVQHTNGTKHRGRDGPIHIPEELAGSIQSVLGLDDGPIAKPHYRKPLVMPRVPGMGGYTGPQLAQVYNAPPGVDGTGCCIRVIALGGRPLDADIAAFFSGIGLATPTIEYVSVDGANFVPGADPNGADVETALDICVSGGMAPGAHIQVFMAPNSDAGFADGWSHIVNDPLPAGCTSVVSSTSWGSPEPSWTQQAMQTMNGIAAQGKANNPPCPMHAAAGDNGSDDGVGDGKPHGDFPASGPAVVGVGGLRGAGPGEMAWGGQTSGGGATGGAPSEFWPKPDYQTGFAAGTTRGVCDVSAPGDPGTGYATSAGTVGGTSGASPMWAGGIALVNQALAAAGKPPIADLHALLYANPHACNDVTVGTNGQYSAGPGYDYPTGLGSPDFSKILAAALGAPTGTKPPPPPPPPPPPVNPPPVLPIAQEIADVDRAFATLEAMQRSPYLRQLLAQANKFIDMILLKQAQGGHVRMEEVQL
jgi:kumamolisin